MNIVMLMMAGSGVRFGADIPKQFVQVDDRPIFSYIVDGYNKCNCVDKIVVVTHANWISYVEEWKDKLQAEKLCVITKGGDTRSESIKNGLRAMESFAGEQDVILIHDATHPYVDEAGTIEVIEAVKEYGGATLGQFQYDTVYEMNEETHLLEQVVPRQKIVSGASPEAFLYGRIHQIYMESPREELEAMTSAGALALRHGIPMKVVQANVINLKITYKNDMDIFKTMKSSYFPVNTAD